MINNTIHESVFRTNDSEEREVVATQQHNKLYVPYDIREKMHHSCCDNSCTACIGD